MKLGLYQHYKGHLYQIIGVSRHTETLEELVVYQSLYGNYGLWVRLVSMFQESVEQEKKMIPRFKYIGEYLNQAPLMKK